MTKNLFTLIPKVDELLDNEGIVKLGEKIPRKIILDSIRSEMDKLRDSIKMGSLKEEEVIDIIKQLPQKIQDRSMEKEKFKLRRVINATGTVIHTNLGRAPLNDEIMDNIREVATNYSNLEYDLENGSRGSRYSHVESIIKEITGAEDALVVNNNAAAVLLALSTLAKDKEVIVSRGELVEIGGSFRIPDVMEESGAHLVEVGTTNKTHLWDYENAITEDTGALLKVHTSNYRILGFTSAIESEELNILKDKYNIPIIEDLGSGVLIDLSKYGLGYEPTVQDCLNKGVDIVTFSGDKLLGGPQAGIIVGKKEYIDRMKRNPLTRAFRVDKFTLSALEGILKYYLDEERAIEKIPTLKMLSLSQEEIDELSKELYKQIKEIDLGDNIKLAIEDSYSEVGGGSMPLEELPTKCIVLSFEGISTQKFENKLRAYSTPIISRLYRDKIYLDVRTLKRQEFPIIVEAIKSAGSSFKECNR